MNALQPEWVLSSKLSRKNVIQDGGSAWFLIDRTGASDGSISNLIVDNVSLDDFDEGGQPYGRSLTPLPWFLIVVDYIAGFLYCLIRPDPPCRGKVGAKNVILCGMDESTHGWKGMGIGLGISMKEGWTTLTGRFLVMKNGYLDWVPCWEAIVVDGTVQSGLQFTVGGIHRIYVELSLPLLY